MKSWSEKVDRVTSEEVAAVYSGTVGFGDLTGVSRDNADLESEITTLEAVDTALDGRITVNEGLLSTGFLDDILNLPGTQNDLMYFNAGGVDRLTLGTNLSITSGVLNAASGGGGGASALNDLSDASVSAPAVGHILQYDGANFSNVMLDLSVIDQVDMTGVGVGDVLRWDGADMVPGSAIDATENLTALRGSVDSAGTIDAGSGFTISKMGTGDYRVNFSSPFSSAPSVVATVRNSVGGSFRRIRVAAESTTSVRVLLDDGSSPVDEGFCFVALGV